MSISRSSATRRDREVLSLSERIAEPVFSIIAMGLLLSFFAYHQYAATGFFTEQFGSIEMLCLFGPIILSPVAAIVRSISGRRNPGRPVEAFANLAMALGALWLLIVFPFDFTHLADALPSGLQFLLAWVSDDIGRVVLVLQVIVGTLVAFFMLLKFFTVLHQQHNRHSFSPTSLAS